MKSHIKLGKPNDVDGHICIFNDEDEILGEVYYKNEWREWVWRAIDGDVDMSEQCMEDVKLLLAVKNDKKRGKK